MRCLRARVVCLRFVRAGRLLFHGSPVALTLGCAHTLLCGRFVFARVVEKQACCGRVCSVGGWGSCLRAGRVRLLVFALLVLARLLGVVGQCGCVRPSLRSLPSGGWGFGAHAFGVGAVLRARWAEGGQVGAGQPCPAPYSVACGARLLRARGRREGLGVLAGR